MSSRPRACLSAYATTTNRGERGVNGTIAVAWMRWRRLARTPARVLPSSSRVLRRGGGREAPSASATKGWPDCDPAALAPAFVVAKSSVGRPQCQGRSKCDPVAPFEN